MRHITTIALTAIATAVGVLVTMAICSPEQPKDEPQIIISNDYARLDEWQLFIMALAEEESGYDSKAVSAVGAKGILQMMPEYIAEANRISRQSFTNADAFNDTVSLDCFAIIQDYYNDEHDIDEAIRLHNPRAGKWYAKRIKMRMETLRRMEEVRELIVNY